MRQKGRKKQRETGALLRTLADFDRPTRVAIVLEVIGTLYDIDGYVGDHLDEDNMRELAKRFDVPLMALCMELDTPVQATPGDLREWCAFERGQAVQ